MRTAHVICQNDTPRAVVLDGTERAEEECNRLAKEEYDRAGRWSRYGGRELTFKEYRYQVFWYVREIPVL